MRLNSSGFIVDPDVDGKWHRVAFESIGCEEEGDELGDLKGNAIFVGEFSATGADDDSVVASF